MCQGIRYVFVGFRSNSPCWHRIVFPVRLQSTPALRTPRYYGHLAITDSSKIPGESYRRLTEINSRYYGLSLLRTYGHLIRSQRCNLLFSLSILRTPSSILEYLHTYQGWAGTSFHMFWFRFIPEMFSALSATSLSSRAFRLFFCSFGCSSDFAVYSVLGS